ncbi:50S ribosomal protein L31 [Candidatus Falkowbacteria bacterium CG23_combo_of_CG06-09_8_20_14_all_49_15]|uniref:Large ribosomal subunit protein bL31 n=1 Tax=Candidatus Falkowbacteria bacterium CG23_combo_of_CG06-09_8_20_14_all_49_15 TaxID=1974572 RepID=A0A2G9ZN62_9BACT|nr:MAG: 50S ribosomal protein L31 [Candidatus Falkowbacteria bacterium CG23_combo_of_CG06-09_8_20_14_all_49_15]
MKKNIHPKYYPDAKASCACGNSFAIGSTLPKIKTELCCQCHPFFTGKQKLVDTARRVEKFQAKMAAKKSATGARRGVKAKRAARAEKKKKEAGKVSKD